MSLRLAYYGDDFSGSADVMEVLAQAGVPTRLFLDPPTVEQTAGLGAVGVAGISRSLPTAEMEVVLRPMFASLKALGAPLVHYKICSTFDSSPQIGSIGRAIDVGTDVFGGPCVPLVVGAPTLGRYVAFGNLFARSGQDSEVFRLDRHPTMSRHPVTPMREADLRVILAEQTKRSVELIDASVLDTGSALTPSNSAVALFDTVSEQHLPVIGQAVWTLARQSPPLFAVGSSGIEYALTAYWRKNGELPDPPVFQAGAVDQIVVVSGSCSPVTARQIAWAREQGWSDIAVPPEAWHAEGSKDLVLGTILRYLNAGRSVIVHAALGPDDPRVEAVRRSGVAGTASRLGRFLASLIADWPVRRVCVAGGDTSGFVARELGVQSFEFVAPIAPGSPLCRIHAPGGLADGQEICFKGGQVGKANFFELVRTGQKQT
jgi:uncharacterized protein YgbK (DUF1537 family)